MKRDMDLCRQILLRVEDSSPNEVLTRLGLSGDHPNSVSEHVVLLEQAGFLDATINRTFGGAIYAIRGLTWEGHEFLDAARDDERWEKAKRHLEEAGITATLAVLKEVLEALARKALGL